MVNDEGYLTTDIDWQGINSVFEMDLALPEHPFLYQPLKIQTPPEINMQKVEKELFSHAVINTDTRKYSETDLYAIDGALDIITYDRQNPIYHTQIDDIITNVDFDNSPNY